MKEHCLEILVRAETGQVTVLASSPVYGDASPPSVPLLPVYRDIILRRDDVRVHVRLYGYMSIETVKVMAERFLSMTNAERYGERKTQWKQTKPGIWISS